VLDHPDANHRVEMVEGIGAEESRVLLQEFFRARRTDNG
jgi:tRNA(Arg) A34 adenosine deaminase TadA